MKLENLLYSKNHVLRKKMQVSPHDSLLRSKHN